MQGPHAPRLIRMHRPTDNLRADHQVVAKGVGALQAIAAAVRAGHTFPVEDTALLLRFLREFVLAVHMRKEADTVWPAVAMRGDDRTAGLVGEVMRLHEEVTALAHYLVLFWEPVADLSPEELSGFADTVDNFASRIARMWQLEESELFSACDASVPADDQLDWVHLFAQLEFERGACGLWAERLRPLLSRWRN